MNVNISINRQNTIKTKDFPKRKECSDNKVLYRVTYGYKSKLSGDVVFPVTYENFNEAVRKTIPVIFPGDIVIYTPQFKEDVNYNRQAIVKKVTSQYAGREAQQRGMDVQATAVGRIENGLRQDQPVGHHHRHLGVQRRELGLLLRALQRFRMPHGQAQLLGARLHRCRPVLLAPPRRARRLAVDAGDLVAGLDQRLQHRGNFPL